MTINEFLERYEHAILSGSALGVVTGVLWLCGKWVAGLLFLVVAAFLVGFFLARKEKRSREVRI